MKRIALGALAGVISLLTFHQAMWTVVWLWSPGSFPRPYHLYPYPPLEFVDTALLLMSGLFWGAVAAAIVNRTPGRDAVETGALVGLGATLFHPAVLQIFVLHPLSGGGPLSPQTVDNIVLPALAPDLAINMAWGIGFGLIYPPLLRRIERQTSPHPPIVD